MSDPQCQHYTIVRAKALKEPDDPLSLPRVCLKCGAAFGIYPLNLKDDPKLKQYMETAAKEMRENIPSM